MPRTRARQKYLGFVLLACAAILYLGFVSAEGTSDVETWLEWMGDIHERGAAEAYRSSHDDYPPGAFAVLTLADGAATRFDGTRLITLKVTLAVFTLGGAIIFGLWASSAWQTAGLLLAMFANAMLFGYLDMLVVPALLLALIALQRRWIATAAFLYTLAVSIKWQPIIIAPFFAVEACRISTRSNWRAWLRDLPRLGAGAIAAGALCLAVFDAASIRAAFHEALSHNSLSLQGLNVNWLVQLVAYISAGRNESLFGSGVHTPEWMLTAARVAFDTAYLALLLSFIRRPERTYADFMWFACVGFYTYCMLSLGVHENHFFVAMVLAFALFPLEHPSAASIAVYLAVASNLNLFLFYGFDGQTRFDEKAPLADTGFLVASVVISVSNALWWAMRFKEGLLPTPRPAGAPGVQIS